MSLYVFHSLMLNMKSESQTENKLNTLKLKQLTFKDHEFQFWTLCEFSVLDFGR